MPMSETKPINLRMPEPIKEALDKHCAKTGVSRSWFILDAICRALAKPKLMDNVREAHRPKADE